MKDKMKDLGIFMIKKKLCFLKNKKKEKLLKKIMRNTVHFLMVMELE